MNLTDYPTPKTDAAANSCFGGDETVDADVSRQLEREAAAWKAIAEMYRKSESVENSHELLIVLDEATEAFDALKSQLEKP